MTFRYLTGQRNTILKFVSNQRVNHSRTMANARRHGSLESSTPQKCGGLLLRSSNLLEIQPSRPTREDCRRVQRPKVFRSHGKSIAWQEGLNERPVDLENSRYFLGSIQTLTSVLLPRLQRGHRKLFDKWYSDSESLKIHSESSKIE